MTFRTLRMAIAGIVSTAWLAACVVEPTEPVEIAEPPIELPEDPAGTVTTNLLTTQYENTFDFESGTVGGDSTNADIALDSAMNFSVIKHNTQAIPKISDAGSQLGLGAVTDLPVQGYVELLAVTKGNGYVVVTKEGNAYRLYVDGLLTSAETGGLMGVRMKWALLKQNVRPVDPIVLTTQLNGTAITVTWTALEGNVLRYRVYYDEVYTGGGQGSPSSDEQPVEDVTTTSYTHTPVASNFTYRFYVTAVYPWGETFLPPSSFDWPAQVVVP